MRIIQKDDPGLIFVPFFSVCTTTRSPEEFGIIFILGCVCVCCLYKKTFLDMTWFDLVFSFLQMQRLRRWRFACSWCVVEYSLE